jgi:hypothetical protein
VSIRRYDLFGNVYANAVGRYVEHDDHVTEVERLTAALQEEQAESLRQAEIARDALTEAERLTATVPTLPDIQTVVSAARCWAKHHDAPDGRIDAACDRLIETLRPRLTALPTEEG